MESSSQYDYVINKLIEFVYLLKTFQYSPGCNIFATDIQDKFVRTISE